MSHSITVLRADDSARAGEILAGVAEWLNAADIERDNAGCAQLWLSLDESAACDAVIGALDQTADDWREHIAVAMRER
jgi:hypothetical protein